MNPQPYQIAYDTAINELTQIAATFEKLRVRKAQIESLVLALQPFFGEEQMPAAPAGQQDSERESAPEIRQTAVPRGP